jgi:hypothetical protein
MQYLARDETLLPDQRRVTEQV